MKENQMSRGKSQSLYKYLPDSWIDFSVRGKYRKNYIAHVERWNSEKLTEINKKRLIRLTLAMYLRPRREGKKEELLRRLARLHFIVRNATRFISLEMLKTIRGILSVVIVRRLN